MSESFIDGRVTVHAGDNREVLRGIADNSVDSIVTDPPYALVSIVKRFGKASESDDTKTSQRTRDRVDGYSRLVAGGFMGKKWDTGETVHAVEFWRECLRVLKPGGHLVSCSGTRTYHRMAVAIEDAGFEIRDMIAWTYGSGFPKSHNQGDGWGTALKPAIEPICLARKPLSEKTVAANVLRWGTGAINIDGCRVATGDVAAIGAPSWGGPMKRLSASPGQEGKLVPRLPPNNGGRWPANIIHDGSDEVIAAFPEAPGQQRGVGPEDGAKNSVNVYGDYGARDQFDPRGDSGSAARFFYQVAKDDRCDLCDANIAASRSPTENTLTASSARPDVAASHRHESAASGPRSNGHAANAANPSPQCLPPKPSIAASNVRSPLQQKIVRNVSSAANLCDSCATGIAQEIVAASRKEPLGLSVSKCSIDDFKKTILLRCLASYVESRESTDTILTITNLRELFGCVFHAIAESINSAKAGSEASTEPAPKRLWYSSKADSDDRLGSKHPTVKPVDLMQWLVRLVTPKGGLVLDPFAGTGTTAEAALREGMRCVLIEREDEYLADIRRRMALVMSGPDERQRESIKAKTKNQPLDAGPLFDAIR